MGENVVLDSVVVTVSPAQITTTVLMKPVWLDTVRQRVIPVPQEIVLVTQISMRRPTAQRIATVLV